MKLTHSATTLARSVKEAWIQTPLIGALIIWSLGMMLFSYLVAGPTFADPDSFYHAKIAEMLLHSKQAIVDFPWLAFTTLTDSYVDHHFLYHVFLVPWIVLFGTIPGVKIATVFLATCTVTLFYVCARMYKVPGAFFFAILLLCNPDFSFRMSLTKATTVGFLFMMSGLYALLKKNTRILALLGFFFVWSYGGFLLLLILAGVASSVRVVQNWMNTKRRPNIRAIGIFFLPVLSVACGMIAGLLIHPSFPHHFEFYWEQIVQIGFVNYSNVIGVGGEWYPYAPADLGASMIIVTALYACSIIAALWHARKMHEGVWITGIMSLFFLLFTIKSRRYVEYYIPWALIFSAYTLGASGWIPRATAYIAREWRSWNTRRVIERAVFAVLFFGSIATTVHIVLDDIHHLHSDMQSGFSTHLFTDAGTWLQRHATEGDIVFHDDWSTFPVLFYQTTKPYYIVGLDPTFMYRYNTDLYWKWANITLGKYDGDMYETIRNDFHARFVFVDSNHGYLKTRFLADKRFTLVYQDAEATIFRIPRQEEAR